MVDIALDSEIKAPPPLNQFEGENEMSPHNRAIENAARYEAILDKKALKKARAKLDKIQRQLDARHVDELLAERQRLIDEYEANRKRKATLIESLEKATEQERVEALSQIAIIKSNQAQIVAEGKAVTARLSPYRHAIQRRDVIKSRIDEHINQERDLAQELKDAEEMRREAALNAELIIRTWNRLGYCHRYTIQRGMRTRTVTEPVQFERIIATPDEIQFQIAVSRMGLFKKTVHLLPNGVRAWDLVKPETCLELSIATKREITSPNTADSLEWSNGAWLRQFRLNFPDGIMERVSYSHVMARYPADRNAEIPLPLGVKAGRAINWTCLSEHPHLLIAGQTGSGKTNAIRVILSTIIEKQSPDDCRIVLIDLKRGGDLNPYEHAPHTIGKVYKDVADVAVLIKQLEIEMRQRMDKIAQYGNDIGEYNAAVLPEQRMPRIAIVFDEYLAIHSKGKELGAEIQSSVIMLATQARAAGIHLVIGIQQSYSDAVDKQVRANITFVLSGRQRTTGAAMSVGATATKELKKIAGRMYCDNGSGQFQVQLPFISRAEVYAGIANAAKWETRVTVKLADLGSDYDGKVTALSPFNADMVLNIAFEQLNGALHATRIYEIINRPDVSRRNVEAVVKKIIEAGTVEWDGVTYKTKRERKYYVLIAITPENQNTNDFEPVLEA